MSESSPPPQPPATPEPASTGDLEKQAPDQEKPVPPRVADRQWTIIAASVATLACFAGAMVLPVPYVIVSPGSTRNVLATGDAQIIKISGHEVHESKEQLRLTTISVAGGPGRAIDLGSALLALVRPQEVVKPVAQVYPPSVTKEEADNRSKADMNRSQDAAAVAGLRAAGIKVGERVKLVGATKEGHADGVVEEGDIVIGLNGDKIDAFQSLRDAVAKMSVGDEAELEVLRDGKEKTLKFKTMANEKGEVRLGVFITPDFELPFDVDFALDRIGGPSAGLVFSLAVVELLTSEQLIKDTTIAGTGTINEVGKVGAIGGVDLKMLAAKRDGAKWFLAPKENCAEVVGKVPDGLGVVAVDTLDDAVKAVKAISAGATDKSALPECKA